MFETFRNAWKIEDLRKRLMYTLLILVLFRVGCAITVPYINPAVLSTFFSGTEMLGYLNMMSGGALSQCAVFALGVSPYINASIIIQLLTVAIPALENLAKEGEEGRRKITRITHYTAMGLAFVMSIGYYFILRRMGALHYTSGWENWFSAVVIILTFTAGSQLITWMGEQIDSKGIGNGVSLLIFTGIVSRWSSLYTTVRGMLTMAASGKPQYYVFLPLLVVLALAAVLFVVVLTNAERRIPVQYAKRVVGRKMYGGQNTFIPIKVNMSGVMPIILASSIVSLPSIIASFFTAPTKGFWFHFLNCFKQDSWVYIILYFVLIIGFAFFYVTIQYNPLEMSNNLRKNSGAIPGYRPGKPTTDYIKRVLSKVTLIGALFLGVIALFPALFGKFSGFYGLTLGGTSIMIVVGVALETTQQIESQMMMRHYKGFLE